MCPLGNILKVGKCQNNPGRLANTEALMKVPHEECSHLKVNTVFCYLCPNIKGNYGTVYFGDSTSSCPISLFC